MGFIQFCFQFYFHCRKETNRDKIEIAISEDIKSSLPTEKVFRHFGSHITTGNLLYKAF